MALLNRTARVANMMRREMAVLLQRETRDPRLIGVTITDIEVSVDLSSARVYVRVTVGDVQEALRGLSAAQGFFRKRLSRSLRLRVVPEIRFKPDDSRRKAQRIEELLNDPRNKCITDEDATP